MMLPLLLLLITHSIALTALEQEIALTRNLITLYNEKIALLESQPQAPHINDEHLSYFEHHQNE